MKQAKPNIIRLYMVEEEDTHHDISRILLKLKVPVELLGVSSSRDMVALRQAVLKFSPQVLLMSIKNLEADTVRELEQIRLDHPKIGLALLLESCDARDIELLRRLALKGEGGTSLFLKQPQERIERLCMAIPAVSQGQVILDLPLANFMFAGTPGHPFLEQLTPRELEILHLLAEGYTNAAIAEALYIDIKTVERHLNSMYGKLKAGREFGDKHLRVSAAKLYLESVVELSRQENMVFHGSADQK